MKAKKESYVLRRKWDNIIHPGVFVEYEWNPKAYGNANGHDQVG